MTKEQAHALLNFVKLGFAIPTWRINKALTITGDLNAQRVSRSLCQTSNDEGLDRVHTASGEGTTRFERYVERITPFGEGAH
jgi:hypothetical protein